MPEKTSRASKSGRSKTADAGAPRAASSSLGGDWRAAMLAEVRRIILAADPGIVEEVKWRKPSNPAGVPAWSNPPYGIVCTGETYKQVVKLTFARGAALADPKKLFNASLEGNARRAIDIREGEPVDERSLRDLIRSAVAENVKSKTKSR